MRLFCSAKLIKLLVLLRSNILVQNNCFEAKAMILLLLRRRIDQITIQEVKPDFTLKVLVELGFDAMKGIKLSFKNLDLPPSHSKKGHGLHAHLKKVFDSAPVVMAKLYGKDAQYRYQADLFYLPGEEENLERIVREGRHLNQELLFCSAKLIELLNLLRSNILVQNNCSEAKATFLLLLRRRIDLKLASPRDEKKRKIDFSKKKFTVRGQDIELEQDNFKSEVCKYINDCKQYLRAAIEKQRVDMMKNEFDPTDEEFLIIYGLKELKEMCMRVARYEPLDWKGN